MDPITLDMPAIIQAATDLLDFLHSFELARIFINLFLVVCAVITAVGFYVNMSSSKE